MPKDLTFAPHTPDSTSEWQPVGRISEAQSATRFTQRVMPPALALRASADRSPNPPYALLALQRQHNLADPFSAFDDFVGAAGFFQRKNLVDQHLQLAFGCDLERQPEIIRRVDRVAEDGDDVEIKILHVERNVAAAVATRA